MNWTPVTKSLPPDDFRGHVVLWTKNKRVMVVAGHKVDNWLIEKYALTHWMIPTPPGEPPALLDWATCDDDYLLPGD